MGLAELMPRAETMCDLSVYTTEELRAELANALKLSAPYLLRLAAIWLELERRGEDMSALRVGLGAYLPLIGSGRMLPELVVKYAGESAVLGRCAKMTVEEQHRVLATGRRPSPPARPKGPSSPRLRGETTQSVSMPSIALMFQNATAQDAVELILSMLQKCRDPKEVVARLRDRLGDR
jgi:hypothetical protein